MAQRYLESYEKDEKWRVKHAEGKMLLKFLLIEFMFNIPPS
jgi:hypothetical protein